jgi:WD40 repeat protein
MSGAIWSTLFRPDGKGAVTSSDAGLQRWQVLRNNEGAIRLKVAETLNGSPMGRGAMSRDGRYVAAIAGIDRVLIYDLEAPAKPVSTGGHPHLGFLDLSPDGRWLATGSWQGRDVMIWDARTGKRIKELPIASSTSVAFSPDGQWLATADDDDVRVWRVGSWRLAHGKRRERNGPVAFSPRGDLLAFTHSLSTVRLLAPETGQELASLETPYPLGLSWLRFSNDGDQLAAAADYMVQLWDIRALRRQLATMKLDW